MVRGVGLGDVNGVVLNFTEGVPGDTATATKGNTYRDRRRASGVDPATSGSASRSRSSPPVPDRQSRLESLPVMAPAGCYVPAVSSRTLFTRALMSGVVLLAAAGRR